MGKLLLILVTGSVITFGVVQANGGLNRATDSRTRAADHLAMVVAEQLSATGLSEATLVVETLSAMPASSTLRGTMMGGTYTVTVQPEGADLVTVRSVGEVTGSGHDGARHVREATFQLVSASGAGEPPVPPFLSQALVLEDNLTMNDAQRVRSAEPGVNANVHTNGGSVINISENAGIEGFYYSVRPIPHDWLRPKLERAFRPNSNPERLAVYQLADRIEMPTIRATDYLSVATQVSAGNQSNVSGVLDFVRNGYGTRENPAVWVIRGDFNTASGRTLQINGYVNIITQGNVNLQGVTTTGANSAVSFYSQQGISLNGTTRIAGSLMANSNIQIGGTGTVVEGPVATRGTLNFNSNAHILYRPLSGYMTRPLFPSTGGAAAAPAPGGARFRPIAYRGA